MILGQWIGKIDEKSRVSFPKRFREEYGEKLIVTKGLDRNLIIVSVTNWESLLEGTIGHSFLSSDVRAMQRFLLGNASFVELDEKGRFLVPSYLKEHASLMTDVVFAGLHRFVELWDVKLWEEEQSLLREKLPSVATRLTEKERNDE